MLPPRPANCQSNSSRIRHLTVSLSKNSAFPYNMLKNPFICRWDSFYQPLPTTSEEVLEMEEIDENDDEDSCSSCEQRHRHSGFLSIESPSGRSPLTSILDAAAPKTKQTTTRLIQGKTISCHKCRAAQGKRFRGPLDGWMQKLVGPKTQPHNLS